VAPRNAIFPHMRKTVVPSPGRRGGRSRVSDAGSVDPDAISPGSDHRRARGARLRVLGANITFGLRLPWEISGLYALMSVLVFPFIDSRNAHSGRQRYHTAWWGIEFDIDATQKRCARDQANLRRGARVEGGSIRRAGPMDTVFFPARCGFALPIQ